MDNMQELARALKDNREAFESFKQWHKDEVLTLRAQVLELAQRHARAPFAGGGVSGDNVREALTKAQGLDDLRSGKIRELHIPVPGGLELKTQIVNATGASQPLVAADRERGIIGVAQRPLRLRDLLPVNRTNSNVVEFTSQSTFTNAARPQGDASPGGIEGEAFAESAMTFSLNTAAVVTLGHWIPASQQVLDDAETLADFVREYLLYGLRLEEEEELLTGDGSAGTINGLNNQATAYNRGATNDSIIETLAKAKTQLELANFTPDGLVLHPADFETLATAKDSQQRYLWGDPKTSTLPAVWGVPIVISNSQTQGRFLMADFARAARIWDRQDAMVEFSTGYQDYFVRHMVAIKCWERITLTVYRATAMVYGATSHAG